MGDMQATAFALGCVRRTASLPTPNAPWSRPGRAPPVMLHRAADEALAGLAPA